MIFKEEQIICELEEELESIRQRGSETDYYFFTKYVKENYQEYYFDIFPKYTNHFQNIIHSLFEL